ncbi:BamA/TamA family outer membrane protein [Spirosoma fluviale]|uniref:Surface antigen n=1 Tax=Spirosoma fluviale TaxID=1597977 RepID=A0A286GAR5_9BACT|nr:BamA/TamA family outer membrane protein [Spirosoma fluviale]SOD92591.1 Surface antigen [Spirosoma fluviale]
MAGKQVAGCLIGILLAVCPVLAQQHIPKFAQRGLGRFIYQTLNDTSSTASSRVLVFPTAGYAPETSLEIGVRAFSLYYAKDDTLVNRLSEIVLYGFVTLRGQFGAQLENAVYTDKNTYYLLGRARYQQFPLLYYGIGPNSKRANPSLVNSSYVQFRQRALRKVVGNLYAGPEVDFQSLQGVSFEHTDLAAAELPLGGRGSTTLELGVTLVYDNRKNILNVRKGAFFEAAVLRNVLRTENFGFQRILFDGRLYRPLGTRNRVLALQATGMFINGDVPFNSLALLGGENTMRGYYLGRYRDKNLLAAQAELRWLPFVFSRRWGGTLFGGVGTVAPTVSEVQLNRVRWAVGGGVRFLFFQKKDVYLRADLGITREGTGIYFSLGEAF